MVTLPERFSEVAARLRQAVAAGSYAQAQEALVTLSRELERAVAENGEKDVWQLAQQVRELLTWARRATLAGRAHDAARLARLRRLPQGYRPFSSHGSTVRLQA